MSTDLGLGLLGQKAANLDFKPSGLLGRRGDGFRSPGVDGLRNPEADLLSQVKLDADDVKKGQAQLIAQAWQKHQRDQRLVSHGHVHAVLKADFVSGTSRPQAGCPGLRGLHSGATHHQGGQEEGAFCGLSAFP